MILYPNIMINKVEEINVEFLNKNKIKALILDVDNTLMDTDKNLKESVIEWAINLQGQGVRLYILSNSNKVKKIKEIAEKMQIKNYFYFALKPLKRGFKKVQKLIDLKPENIGVVGDQIFTDVIGGNRCKMFTILVEPIDKKDIWITKIKRPLEEYVKNKYKKTIAKEKKEK